MNSSPISVEEAIRRVVAATQPLAVERLTLSTKLLGRTLAEPLISKAPFPHFRASIMDGYAVCGPLQPGVYRITQHMHAGDASKGDLAANEVSYIATGAKVPDTANAVVKIEETRKISEEEVEILVAVKEGDHIRQIGSDIEFGEEVLAKGTVLGPIELGLMATTGFTEGIPCLRRPVIGVMSTGNELVDPSTPDAALGEAQVRDSNRITLIGSFQMEHFEVIDYGIMPDDLDTIRAKLWQAVRECDVVITSGGVSMGNKDYIKFLLLNDESFSPHVTLHFNKLNMKPGKPTTFATITSGGAGGGDEAAENKQTLFFGLPGNPVSCIVTKTLFVDVALRRLQGFSALQSLHTEVTVTLLGDKAITLDPERPEYHRVSIFATGPSTSSATGPSTKLVAYSTGNQRSSRLLSMKTANGLLYLPQGPGKAVFGQEYRALLISQLPVPILDQDSMHKLAAAAEEAGAATAAVASLAHLPRSFTDKLQAKAAASSAATAATGSSRCCPAHLSHADGAWKHIRVGILTISDRASTGTYQDDSGPEIAKILTQWAAAAAAEDKPYPLHFEVTRYATVPDSPDVITSTVLQWTNPQPQAQSTPTAASVDGSGLPTPDSCATSASPADGSGGVVDLLLTSGGTGFGPRDFTPETISPLLHRPAPGIAQALLQEGLKYTPLAVLARPVAGTRHQTFIATLPGSVKAVRENLVALKPLLPRIMELLKTPRDEGLYSSHGVHGSSAAKK